MTSNTFFIGDFDDSMEYKLLEIRHAISEQASLSNGKIELIICSEGGYAGYAWALVDLMERAKLAGVTVVTVVSGEAFSCGSVVAVAGSPGHRYIGHNAEHLVHLGSVSSHVTTDMQHSRQAAYTKRHFNRVLNHYRKYANIPDLEESLADDNLFVPAARAKSWSMADQWIDKLPL